MIVQVNDKPVNKDTISNYIFDKNYYEQDISEIKKEFIPLYYRTYISNQEDYTEPQSDDIVIKNKEIEISDKDKSYPFRLFLYYNPQIRRSRVAIIRTIGMKIEDKKITNYVKKPFNAILMPENLDGDVRLKSLENESHTILSADYFKDDTKKKSGKKFINNISREIKQIIDEIILEKNPTDGKMDTEDIIFEETYTFKTEEDDKGTRSKITQKQKAKQITKVSPSKRKKEKDSLKDNIDINIMGEDTQKSKPDKKGNKNKTLKNFVANPERVERVIINDHEYVSFDFTGTSKLKNINNFDLGIHILDGDGKEEKEPLVINENYNVVTDNLTKKNCVIEDNKIKEISIKNNKAAIDINLKREYNHYLKFIYYIEV